MAPRFGPSINQNRMRTAQVRQAQTRERMVAGLQESGFASGGADRRDRAWSPYPNTAGRTIANRLDAGRQAVRRNPGNRRRIHEDRMGTNWPSLITGGRQRTR